MSTNPFGPQDPAENEMRRYPREDLNKKYQEDDGTIEANIDDLEEAVVGHKIVRAERAGWDVYPGHPEYREWSYNHHSGFEIELDNGKRVRMEDTQDCCAFTTLNDFLLNVKLIDHVITGVGTTDGATTWHIYADMGDVLTLQVGWSCGNPFYYGYGFDITVENVLVVQESGPRFAIDEGPRAIEGSD